ncbi:MAG: AAA-like domain-containing protein [Blastocatellia bacterium]|nr:AAA-like domain-containing protein [Blastocatellia bacterium]
MTTTEMKPATDSFYVTGGTLRRDAACYVKRRADQALYDGAMQGKFCYVLTSRQMGKSSLMVRTAARLREAEAQVVVLDLTAIGQNLSAEQWYDGLLGKVGQQLDLEDELEDFWADHPRLSYVQRWINALCEVVLPERSGRVVIFVDEIDAVRSLPFSTDEFFAAIRELYNRRTEDAELERLTFCLLGVATPSDLIRDTRTTPFNIGQRIELNDFTDDEAAPLSHGLGRDERTVQKLLKRILYWTGGHPYLTQRLCQAVAADANVQDAGGVDRLCEELFFTTRARERDDNLLFVRERLLKSEADRAALLDLYKKLRENKRVKDDETNPLISVLRLSGITRVTQGLLYVRNRIYYRVFDREWVLANLPDAEVQRQKAAYRRGVMRTATIAAVMLAVVSSLALLAYWQRNRAVESEAAKRKLLYTAQMNLAGQDWENGNIGRVRELLSANVPISGQQDERGFEWFHLWQQVNRDLVTLDVPKIRTVYLSHDRKTLAVLSSGDEVLTLWDIATWKKLHTLKAGEGDLYFVAFSPDDRTLYSQGFTGKLKMWEISTGKEIRTVDLGSDTFRFLACSPDGKLLAITRMDGKVTLLDTDTGKEVRTFQAHKGFFMNHFFSPDGKQLITASGNEESVKIWEVNTATEIRSFKVKTSPIRFLALSPDGTKLAVPEEANSVRLFDVRSGKVAMTLKDQMEQQTWYRQLVFSPDGAKLAGEGEKFVQVWNVKTGHVIGVFRKQSTTSGTLDFLADGKRLLSKSKNSELQVWNLDPSTMREPDAIRISDKSVLDIAWAPDGKSFATSDETGKIVIRDATTYQELGLLQTPITTSEWVIITYSADGQKMVSFDDQNVIRVWEIKTARLIHSFAVNGKGRAGLPPTFSWDGSKLAFVTDSNILKLVDVNSGVEVFTDKGDGGRPVAFSPDGKVIAAGEFRTGLIKLFDLSTSKELAVLQGPSPAWSISFSRDGKLLASGTNSGDVSLWEVQTGRQISTTQGHAMGVMSVSFAPDGKRFATGSFDKKVKIWDAQSGQELLTLTGHTNNLYSVAFSPDGKTLLSTGEDKTLRLWHAATDTEVQARRGQ